MRVSPTVMCPACSRSPVCIVAGKRYLRSRLTAQPQHFKNDKTKSSANIRFEALPMKVGTGWRVVITSFPDRADMEIPNFATEADARNWITNDSEEWLSRLGYGYGSAS